MKFTETTDAPRATPAEVFAMYRRLWGDKDIMNGYTKGLTRAELLKNEREAVASILADDPQNEYWLNRAEQLKQAAEIEADAEWIADAEADHADWKDWKATQEGVL